ncbi:hypothetical protein [Microcoleus sp. FACHB-68]|uniref:hypothetical protein n=1 Tax=Microcoleus sp. FACHB-68 TaxID=2692826 RepID=UPI0016872C0D|nr:hypothetical protein [Microcoleus sp. FACHB-68]
MTASRFLHKASLKRHTYLAIMALPDEASAFQAYRLLQYHGISPEHLAIVGEGYSSAERVGLLEPTQIALRKARRLAMFTGAFGAVMGAVALSILNLGFKIPLSVNLMLVIPASSVIAGFFGAVLGALFGFLGEGSTAGIYRHHLRQGHYLLMMEGPEKLVRLGQDVLKQYCLPKSR